MSLAFVAPTAQARPSPSKLKVTLSVSTKSATTGTPIRFSGRVSKGGSGATAMLQRRQGSSAWSTVKASKVPQSRRVAFAVKTREGRSTYRIIIAKTKRSTSPSVTVTGRSRSTPPAVPSVTAGTISHHQQIKSVCAHIRTLEHLHVKYGNDNYLIGMLLDQISRAWNGLRTPPIDVWGAAGYLPKGQTLQDWWEMGIHPQDVRMLADAYAEPNGQIPLFGHDIVRSAFPTPYEPSDEEAEELVRELLLDMHAPAGPGEPWAMGF